MSRDRAEAELVLDGVTKTYGAAVVVDHVDLRVKKGELLSLLGPSGCGKTTTLRIIAGFIQPTHGRVWIQGRDVTARAPYERDTAMVFQNYALFPHLTVYDNIAFGLRRRRVSSPEIARRVADMLSLVQLQGLEPRLPRQLSGGQQQRVAVARALVVNPAVLLLDEPLSNLDAKLRASTRVELRRLQETLGLTAVFVTHDQEEAMALSDRIAVMQRGRVLQVGMPREIYDAPADPFVAEFIGTSNTFSGTVRGLEDQVLVLETSAGTLRGLPSAAAVRLTAGASARLIVRAEDIRVSSGVPAPAPEQNVLAGKVEVASYLGASSSLFVRLADGSQVVVHNPGRRLSDLAAQTRVTLCWPRSQGLVFPCE